MAEFDLLMDLLIMKKLVVCWRCHMKVSEDSVDVESGLLVVVLRGENRMIARGKR